MPKVGQTPKKTTPKAAPKKAPAKHIDVVEEDPALFWSDDDDEQQEAIIIMGEIGSGKTYCAGTASEYWPRTLPAKKITTLEDMFWFQTDRKATAGFKGDKIRVATFDLLRMMNKPAAYKPLGFEKPPDWADAVEVGINKCYDFCDRAVGAGLRPKIVVDTITGFDTEQYRFANDEAERIEAAGANPNQYRAFALHGNWHRRFFGDLIASGADVIFCAHQQAQFSNSPGGRDKAITVRVAGYGDALFVPDMIGKVGPKLYKRHTTMQLIMKAWIERRGSRQTMRRELLIGINPEGGEAKNRYERALAPLNGRMSPPDLGKILEMVKV